MEAANKVPQDKGLKIEAQIHKAIEVKSGDEEVAQWQIKK